MSKILITGINGFIGSHVAERLVSMGHFVKGLVRKTSDLKFIHELNIEVFYGDITQIETLQEPLKYVDIGVHVAGLTADWGEYAKFEQANFEGTKNVAKIAEGCGIKRFVYISSSAIHGFPNLRFMDENSPTPKTIFPYCETKKIAEQWLFNYSQQINMEFTVIRPGNVFGPRDHTFIEKYLAALEQKKLAYIDGGKHWTCPTYIDNLIDAIVESCFKPEAKGEAFIVTDGLKIDWKTFTNRFADALGRTHPKLSVPFNIAYLLSFLMEKMYKLLGIKSAPLLTRYRICNGGRDYHFSIEKARKVLSYSPKVSLDEAVKRTVDWYINREI